MASFHESQQQWQLDLLRLQSCVQHRVLGMRLRREFPLRFVQRPQLPLLPVATANLVRARTLCFG